MVSKIKILHREGWTFEDRTDAARQLAHALISFQGKETVMLGIPRGGVIIASEIAKVLQADMDIVLCRKIGAPGYPEFAVGAVNEHGGLVINESALSIIEANPEYIDQIKKEELDEINRRKKVFRSVFSKKNVSGKIVIITDDGVATGTTMQAAIWAIKEEGPQQIILALPVGPEETIKRLAKEVNETVVLCVPSGFQAVGQYYLDFHQLTDEDVKKTLMQFKKT